MIAIAHMPYLCNPSSANKTVLEKSKGMLARMQNACEGLAVPYLVVHPGSHLGAGFAKAKEAIAEAMPEPSKEVKILFENLSGYKNSVGSSFSELGEILEMLDGYNTGICLDTCHAYAAGYDIASIEGMEKMTEEIDRYIGNGRINAIHLNDSKGGLGSGLDRHWHIGKGRIGNEGFRNFFMNNNFGDLPCIMETPVNIYGDDKENMDAATLIARSAGIEVVRRL